jgi:hypothetical protein
MMVYQIWLIRVSFILINLHRPWRYVDAVALYIRWLCASMFMWRCLSYSIKEPFCLTLSIWPGAMFIMSLSGGLRTDPSLLRHILHSKSHGYQTKNIWFPSCRSKQRALFGLMPLFNSFACQCILPTCTGPSKLFQLINSSKTQKAMKLCWAAAQCFLVPWSCDSLLIAILGYRMQVWCFVWLYQRIQFVIVLQLMSKAPLNCSVMSTSNAQRKLTAQRSMAPVWTLRLAKPIAPSINLMYLTFPNCDSSCRC